MFDLTWAEFRNPPRFRAASPKDAHTLRFLFIFDEGSNGVVRVGQDMGIFLMTSPNTGGFLRLFLKRGGFRSTLLDVGTKSAGFDPRYSDAQWNS